MKGRVSILFENTIFRYLFGIAAVAGVFALRIWLIPLTGTGAPYVLFFAAVLATSLFAGVGPAICAVLLSMPLGVYTFVVGAGYSIVQASFQSLLFAVDGIVVIYLTSLIKKGRQATQDANRQLQESEERFRLTIDEAPIGMALVALDGRFVRVNRALCEIVGYGSAELTGLTFQAITHPADLDADLALLDQLARGEIPRYHLSKRYIRKDGTIVDIQLSTSILRSREGAPLYYIAQIEDITDRKRAEAALKDSERRLSLALDSAQIGMWDLDLLTDTSVRSLRHDQIFGYSAAVPTWGAAVFMTHVVPEDREIARQAFEKAFVSDNFDMECRILWADESIHWISAKGRVYRNPKGDPVRMMGTVLDVTEQKRAQEALQR
ncbi:MAG: PAS domain S-box protein, partial [Vicinamibacterales bacterium]